MTRTPDAHFRVEARHQGAKVVVFSPDFSQTSKVGDEWIPMNQGQDGAFWMAVNHVILQEFYVNRETPSFSTYLKENSDAAFLVQLEPDGQGGYKPGAYLRASQLAETKDEELAEWKMFVLDEENAAIRLPVNQVGHRWQPAHEGPVAHQAGGFAHRRRV